MTLNPIYKNELKLLGRSKQIILYVLLFNTALAVVTMISLYIIGSQSASYGTAPYSMIRTLYLVILTIEICMLTVLVPPVSAGSIAGERERQTLDILLSSGLPVNKIVIGKFLSSVSLAVFLMLSSLPVMALVTMYGGTDPGEVYKSMAYTILYIFLAASAGLFCSCFFRKTTSATVAAFVILLLITIGSTVVVVMITMASSFTDVHSSLIDLICLILWLFNPAITYTLIAAEIDTVDLLSINSTPLLNFIQGHYIIFSIVLQVIFIIVMLVLTEIFLRRYCEGK